MSNYRLIQILTAGEGGLTANQRIDVNASAASPTFSAVTVDNDLNVSGQINGNLSSNTSFTAHTGDTTIHFTKDSINLSDLGSSAHTHIISEVVNLQTTLDGKVDGTTFNTHTGDTTIHYTKGSINLNELGSTAHTHTISEVVNLQSSLNAKSSNAWQTFSSTTGGQTVVTAATVDDTVILSGINLNILTDNVSKTLTLSASTNDFTTGTTLVGETIYYDRNDTLSAYTTDLSPLFRTKGSIQTTGSTAVTADTIDNLVDAETNIVEVYVKASTTGATQWGVWKRTLVVTKVSGTPTIQHENADVDKTSNGLNANSVDFIVNGGNINIEVTGIVATTIDWETSFELIL